MKISIKNVCHVSVFFLLIYLVCCEVQRRILGFFKFGGGIPSLSLVFKRGVPLSFLVFEGGFLSQNALFLPYFDEIF
jgi:hypothetical protein